MTVQLPNTLQDFLTQLTFRSNPNLRPAGMEIGLTKDMFNELKKCSKDPIYFIRKYIKIVHVDRGLIPFDLYPYQEEMVTAYKDNRRVITLLPRQMGKSQTTAAFICWYVLFNDEKTVAILANKAATAREILQRVETAYEFLPKWMQSGVRVWNKGSLELENGSRIIASATSSSAIRGYSISLLYCVAGNTKIRVRNKKTGIEQEIEIGEFANNINNTYTNSSTELKNDFTLYVSDKME